MLHNVGLLLTKRAHLNPTMQGYVDADTGLGLSYAELNERSNQTANMLIDLGVKKGDRVSLLLMNGVEFMESFFAIAKIGGIVVPLNWRLIPDELSFILKDSGARVTSSVGHTISYDVRNSIFNPTEGYVVRLEQDLDGLLGDAKYFKNRLSGEFHYPITDFFTGW